MQIPTIVSFCIVFVHLSSPVFAQSGSCSPSVPCKSGCCSKTGFCGFGPAYCGNGNCTSSCNAQAECGQYAPTGSKLCPLNVCCSKYGFCGTTSEFCGPGCQNGCAAPDAPSCPSSSGKVQQFRIGYFESWAYNRVCDAWTPEMIDANAYTHLYYAFGLVSAGSYGIGFMNDFDPMLYKKMLSLKEKNPQLKVFISIGGWSAGGRIFSAMTSTPANRASFIDAAIKFMNTYLFDGIDIDWEYPVAPERGGKPADKANFVSLLKELRAAAGNQFQISATIPSSYWYMQNFDIVNMEKYIDWFMLLSYDIHGTWDGSSPYTQAVVNPHTNLTEINEALKLLWRNDINPNNVVMGLAMYGRSFTLKNPSCNKPGCPFSSGGKPGRCTTTSGILSNAEIQDILKNTGVTPVLNTAAAVKYITWNNNQWVSYDDAETYSLKKDFANSKCLAGYMVWAVDFDDGITQSSTLDLASDGFDAYKSKNPIYDLTAQNNAVNLGLYWTPCTDPSNSQVCAPGWQPIARALGKVFDIDLGHVVDNRVCGLYTSLTGTKFLFRELCAPLVSLTLAGCQWGAMGKLCDATCPTGSVLVSMNSWPAGSRVQCKAGTYVPLCCNGAFTFPQVGTHCFEDPLEHMIGGSFAVRKDISNWLNKLEAGTAGLSRRRLGPRIAAGPVNTTEMELSKRWDPFTNFGGFDDCFGAGALPPGAIPVEIPGIITTLPGDPFFATIVPVTDYAIHHTSTTNGQPTVTIKHSSSSTTYETKTKTCDFNKYPQACANYQSVGQYSNFARPTCSRFGVGVPPRPLTAYWNAGHNSEWSKTWISKTYVNPYGKRQVVSCQRDEWPPAMFQQGRAAGYVRLIPGGQNGGVANSFQGGWNGFCKFPAPSDINTHPGGYQHYGNLIVTTEIISTTVTLKVMDYSFTNAPNTAGDRYSFLLSQNPCYPSTLTVDPNYPLLAYDPSNRARILGWPYYVTPPASLTQGKTPPTRRLKRIRREAEPIELDGHSILARDEYGDYIVDEGNSTRRATDEELLVHLNLAKCLDRDCSAERHAYEEYLKEIREESSKPVDAASPLITPAETDFHKRALAPAASVTLKTAPTGSLQATMTT